MDTQTLIEALRSLQPEDMEWKFALYNVRKGRDGLELDWNLCNMSGIAAWVDTVRTVLLKKTIADRTVTDYSPFISDKEHIGAFEKDNDIIKDQLSNILSNIQNGAAYAPEEFVTGTLPKTAGFGFYGEGKDEQGQVKEQVLLMRRGSPFLSGGKFRLCVSDGGAVVNCDKPILKFTPAADFLYIGGICYFLSSAIGKDFALESRHIAIAEKCLQTIADDEIINNYDQFEKAVMKASNVKKFINFDEQILKHITRLGVVEREEFLSTYGVTIDVKGRMETIEPEQCELIIDLLCCRSCLDPLGRLAIADNITSREE